VKLIFLLNPPYQYAGYMLLTYYRLI